MDKPSDACEIEFRRYSQGDEGQIIDLLKDNWRYLQSENASLFWNWLYKSGPFGGALIVLADHNGKVVGHYAMFPMRMRFGRRLVNGGKAEGSVVHEDYRGNVAPKFCPSRKEFRIFGELIDRLWTEAAAAENALVWGFPNAPALKPQVRAGYSHLEVDIIDLVRPRDIRSTVKLYYSSAAISRPLKNILMASARAYCRTMVILRRQRTAPVDVALRRIGTDDLDDRLKRLFDRYALENDSITIERDLEYIRWRFVENPVVPHRVYVAERDGEFAAMIALSISRKDSVIHANIVDVVGLRGLERELAALLDFALRDIEVEGTACVRTWLSDCEQSSGFVRILKRAGFFGLPRGLRRPHVDLIYKLLDEKLDKAVASDPVRWYITMAFTEGTS